MKHRKLSIVESWEDVLRTMGMGELMGVVYEQEDYMPEIVTMAKKVLKQKFGLTDEDIQAIPQSDHDIVKKPMTRDLLIDVLTKLGGRVDFESDDYEDDGSCDISFSYMGKSFYANANNDKIFDIRIKY